MHISTHFRSCLRTAVLLSACVGIAGCSAFSGGTKIHQSARGSVYLQEVVDWSYEASHPAVIDQTTMLKIVKGIYADESVSASAKMPVAGSKPMRIFSDEDAEFLAPLLAQGLSQAKPEQIVGFTVSSSTGSGAEPRAGTLYIQQGTVHFTIAPSRSIKLAGFMPASAARVEQAPVYAAGGTNGTMSLVIDYQALARSPMPSPALFSARQAPGGQSPVEPQARSVSKQEAVATVQVVPVSGADSIQPDSAGLSNDDLLNKKLDELQKARAVNEAKAKEIKLLRKELEWMKRELRERTDEIKAMQSTIAHRKPAPKKRTAEARPTR
jgi:hypothetical protein